jgi:hypothetical protein
MGTSDVKVMSLRRDAECICGFFVPKGTTAGWHRVERIVLCMSCLEPDEPAAPFVPIDIGVPGGSLQRQYEARMNGYEERERTLHPIIGGLRLLLKRPPQQILNLATGAEGERAVAAYLERKVGDSVLLLYNRRLAPGKVQGDLDILAVAPSGIFLIDPKKYAGRIRVARAGDAFVVNGRRRTDLVDSMRRHVELVAAAVRSGPLPRAPIQAAYCFVNADLPLLRAQVDGVPVMTPRSVAEVLRRPGPLDQAKREVLHADLAQRFPPA